MNEERVFELLKSLISMSALQFEKIDLVSQRLDLLIERVEMIEKGRTK